MKLSISNIAWSSDNDSKMLAYLKNAEFTGLEIAPTRIFSELPYEKLAQAAQFADMLKQRYQLEISSMQSIWFGRVERIFGTEEERLTLVNYTQKAIDFAVEIGCKNLVFGCPKNRISGSDGDMAIAVSFFHKLGEYALKKGTVLSIEPNPVLYGTNFINRTPQAFGLVKQVDCEGFRVNVDFGTILYNQETLAPIEDNLHLVNHVHISEPGLIPVEKRSQHKELANILRRGNYQKFVSIEMKNTENIELVQETITYIKEVFM